MSSPLSKNISLFISANQNYKSPVSSPRRGVGHRHQTLGWDAVDAGGVGRLLAPDETLFAYGEVVWSWRRDTGVKLAGSIPPATVAIKPLTGESAL
jgi:hypothetical protein